MLELLEFAVAVMALLQWTADGPVRASCPGVRGLRGPSVVVRWSFSPEALHRERAELDLLMKQ
jgi:hypothetical protein